MSKIWRTLGAVALASLTVSAPTAAGAVGPPAGGPGCFTDAPADGAREAEIVQYCVEYSATLSFSLTAAQPLDPSTDAGWLVGTTGVAWDIYVDGDDLADYSVYYAVEDVLIAGSYSLGFDDTSCDATANYEGGRYVASGLAPSCFGSPAAIRVEAFYLNRGADSDSTAINGPVVAGTTSATLPAPRTGATPSPAPLPGPTALPVPLPGPTSGGTPAAPGATGPTGQMTRLYQAYFLRPADAAGLAYWMGRLSAGATLDSISEQFTASAEYLSTYGSLTSGDFVKLVYRNVLARQPDDAGYAHWSPLVDNRRIARGQMMIFFSESPEFKAKTATS